MASRQEKPSCCAEPLLQLPRWVVSVQWTDFKGRTPCYSTRYQTMKQLHSSHLGINGYLRRARECLFWPSMSTEIKEYITQYEICSQYSAKQAKEPLMGHEPTNRPWEEVAVNICNLDNKDYLISVDYFSNLWEIDRLRDTKASSCARKLKSHFGETAFLMLSSQTTDHNSPLQSLLSSEENGALSIGQAVLVINRQMVRLNLLSRRPRACSGRQRKAKMTPTSQSLQHERPLQNIWIQVQCKDCWEDAPKPNCP